jgi:hypothetical protein
MPEFEVAKPQVVKKEFKPSRESAVAKIGQVILDVVEQKSQEVDRNIPKIRHAPLKRGRLPAAMAMERRASDRVEKIIGEINEHDSVFSDALSQKLSSRPSTKQNKRPAERMEIASDRTVLVEKTTRVLDENYQEIEELPSSAKHSSQAECSPSRSRSLKEKQSQCSKKNELSLTERNVRQRAASCDARDTTADSRKSRCSCCLKGVLTRWWDRLTGFFKKGISYRCLERGRARSTARGKLSTDKTSDENRHETEGQPRVNAQQKMRSRSSRRGHTRRDFIQK